MIEVDHLVKRFGRVTAVDGLTFTVRPGHVTGFLGPNGAGKTTTMRVILGLDVPTSGHATVNRQSYPDLVRPLHQVGALLDASALHPGRTAQAHLSSLARSNGIGRRRVAEMLQLTGLEPVAGRRLKGFSLGMKQRLGIAAALLGDPPVLMLDEPVNGLDTEGIAWIRQFLKALAADGRTVLVSSHLMSEMAQTADRLIVIGRGALIADTTTAELIQSSQRQDVLLRTPRAAEMASLLTVRGAAVSREDDGALAVTGLDAVAIGDLAAEHGIAVHALIPRAASLEEAYLDLTGMPLISGRLPHDRPRHDRSRHDRPQHDRSWHDWSHRPGPRRARQRVDQVLLGPLDVLDAAGRGAHPGRPQRRDRGRPGQFSGSGR